MRPFGMWVLALALSGCGLSETAFHVDVLDELCRGAASCEGTFEAEACYDHLRQQVPDGCDYDPKAAKECRAALDEAECVDNGDVGTTTYAVPDACQQVYPCGEWSLRY